MSGRTGRDPDDEKRDRIKFPFGHSVDGPLDEVLRSDAGPVRFDSDEGPLLDDDDDDDDDLPLDKTHPESLDAFDDDLSASDPALPVQRPPAASDVVYESGEGPVSWAPRFPGAPVDHDEDDEEPQPLSPSEVGRIIDVEVEKNPPKRLFDPIPPDPSLSGRLRAAPPDRAPAAPPRTPFDPPPPEPDVVQRSEVPTQRIDPALVDPPTFVTGGGPGPRVPGTPSGRHVTPLGPRPPATPSGRQPAVTPLAGDDPATLHTYVPSGSAPPPSGRHVKPLGPRPPATPSGRHARATPLAGDDPATLHTYVPTAAPPPAPGSRRVPAGSPQAPGDAASEAPTRAPGRPRPHSPFEDLSVEDAPPIIVPLSASEEDGRQRQGASTSPSTTGTVLDLERTHPHSEPEFPSGPLDDSLPPPATDDLPRGLTSGDELRWPSDSSPTLDALEVGSNFGSNLGSNLGASSSIGGPLLRGVVSDEGSALAGSSMGSGAVLPLDDSGSDVESLGRRTAELEVPDVVASGHRRLFEDSDITTIPSLPELIGSTEGPVAGLLDSQELEGSAVGLPPPGAEGGVSPSLRLVQVSVERVVGLWEGDTAWVLASLGGALVGPILIAAGWEYYSLALELRPGHPLHTILRPGGSMGLVFGLAGAGLFLLNLTYVLRRRLGVLKRWISLRVWLNAHFICGLTGGSFILAHSALLANNDVARVSSMAIAVAIASGIFGRYVLSHIPRRRDGEGTELSEREHVATRLIELRRQLRTRLGNQPDLRDAALAALATDAVSQVSGTGEVDDAPVTQARPRGVLYLGPLILSDLAAAARWVGLSMKVRRLLRRTDDPQVKKMLNETLALARVQRLEQRMAQFDAVQDLMDTWRGLHFIVALIVITTMALHVTIVLRYGRLDWLG